MLMKQSQRRVATIERQTSEVLRIENSKFTVYTLVNGMTGHVDGNISLETLPSLDTLFELDEMCGKVTNQILGRGSVATYLRRHLLVENDTK